MIPCIFAYAKGAETQSAAVELSDPIAALFLVRNDERASAALHAWLADGQGVGATGLACPRNSVASVMALPPQAAKFQIQA